MADNARTIIKGAYEQLKIYAPGQEMNAADAARGLSEMNQMLDEWSNETLTCFANIEESFTMVPGQNSYTIGQTVGADVNAKRPLMISTAPGTCYIVDVNNNRYPVEVIEQDQWNMIGQLTNTSQLPDTIFYDPQFPLGIINIFPTPTIAYPIFFDSRLQLADLANLDVFFSLPPGYMSAIQNNLSIRLWPFFKQGDPTGYMMKKASDALANVKRTNIKMSPSTYDSAVVSRAQSTYNIYSDNQGGRSDR